MYRRRYCLRWRLSFDFEFTERLYLSNVSRNGVVSSSAVYSEAPLILNSFCKGRAQQITASGVTVTAMEKVRLPKLSPVPELSFLPNPDRG